MTFKPGTELDVQLATKFGLEINWEGKHDEYPIYRNGEKGWFLLPRYSTAWNEMQLVVEEMQRRGFDVAMESYLEELNTGTLYHARFEKRIEGDYGEYDSIESFPHAVCMAALSALEGQADVTEEGGGTTDD